jgi:hypothetical protein
MTFVAHVFEEAGDLFYSIPAALTILLSREWFCARMTGEGDADILANFSLLSFMGLSLTGAAPGGLLRESARPVVRFVSGQLWLLFLIFVGVIYVLLKGPVPGSFSARFSAALITQSWALFVFNFTPVPPFDASLIYFARMMQWRFFTLLVTILSSLTLFAFSYSFWRMDFLTGRFIAQWLKLL